MNNDLYRKKNDYERLIKMLNDNYAKLESCYNNLVLCQKKIKINFTINDEAFQYKKLDSIIKTIEDNKNKIKNNILPEARYQYNNVLLEISKL